MATIKSIEEKARRYDKALERANKLKETCDSNAVVGWMEYIFPELKESGDIRKRIIDALHGDVLEMGEIKKAIAWLEKQGNLMKALQISNARIGELIEKNYYLKEQLEKQGELKKHDVCDNCDQQGSCVSPCPMKLVEKQGEQKPVFEMKTPEESLGIDSDTYNKIVDECVYGKQKSAWSEEDKEMSRFIGNAITADDSSVYLKSKGIEVIDAHVWLDELKDRVQPKQEWSEEDNRMCKAIIDNIKAICEEGYFVGNIDSGELIDWLKSLKERYTWRPSDEQMNALNYVVNLMASSERPTENDLYYNILKSLRQQLMKLKG